MSWSRNYEVLFYFYIYVLLNLFSAYFIQFYSRFFIQQEIMLPQKVSRSSFSSVGFEMTVTLDQFIYGVNLTQNETIYDDGGSSSFKVCMSAFNWRFIWHYNMLSFWSFLFLFSFEILSGGLLLITIQKPLLSTATFFVVSLG